MCDNNWDKFCKSEFAWIREQLTNSIPHKINLNFWKMFAAMLGFGGLIVAILQLIK